MATINEKSILYDREIKGDLHEIKNIYAPMKLNTYRFMMKVEGKTFAIEGNVLYPFELFKFMDGFLQLWDDEVYKEKMSRLASNCR